MSVLSLTTSKNLKSDFSCENIGGRPSGPAGMKELFCSFVGGILVLNLNFLSFVPGGVWTVGLRLEPLDVDARDDDALFQFSSNSVRSQPGLIIKKHLFNYYLK